jgi:hypothetical protein
MYNTFKHDGIDYLSEMLSTFDNIITYGSAAFESNAELRHMVLDIFNTAMTSDQLGVSDQIAACKLADVFLLVLKSSIREAIPGVVPLCLSHINNTKASILRKWSVLVILDALCFNTLETLQVLEQSQATGVFFAVTLQMLSKYTRVHDKKVIATAFMSILSLDPSQTPRSVQDGYGALVVGLLQVLVGLPKAIQKAKEEQDAFENLDEDESGDTSSASYRVEDESKDADADVIDEDSELRLKGCPGLSFSISQLTNISYLTDEYLELLAKEGERLRARAEGGATDDTYDDDGFEDEADAEDDDDDTIFVSREFLLIQTGTFCLLLMLLPFFFIAMNSIPVFDGLRNLVATSAKFQQVASSLPAEDQQLLQTVSQFKDEELPLPSSIPIA